MYIGGLDELDNKILSLIEKNARLSYTEIGKAVGLSRVAVKNRITVLEQRGIIVGYYTKINTELLAQCKRFIMHVFAKPENLKALEEQFGEYEEVKSIERCDSEGVIKLECITSTNQEYADFIDTIKQDSAGIVKINIYIAKDK